LKPTFLQNFLLGDDINFNAAMSGHEIKYQNHKQMKIVTFIQEEQE
jgi:hypothetical protein